MHLKNTPLVLFLRKTCNGLENIIALAVILAVLITLVRFIYETFVNPGTLFAPDVHTFVNFLSLSLQLVIGLEFVHMLVSHKPDTVVDILLFATARKIITDENLKMYEYGIGILAVAILFVLRHYPELIGLRQKGTAENTMAGTATSEPADTVQGVPETPPPA
jgi:hypothetical protein